jgi:DNA-binding response OmpR family regulator
MLSNGSMPTNNVHFDSGLFKQIRFFTTLVVAPELMYSVELQEFLKQDGHFVQRAETFQEALDKTREQQPDLILLDSELGGGTGLGLFSKLLMEQAGAAVVILARNPNIEDSVEAMRLGAADYLPRPFNLRKLKLTIDMQKTLFRK